MQGHLTHRVTADMITRSTKLLVAAFVAATMVFAVGVAPAAAQENDEYAAETTTAVTAAVEAEDGEVQVSVTVTAPAGVVRVEISFNPVVYSGPVPTGPVSFTVPDCGTTVTTTYFFADGSSTSDSVAVNGVGDCFRPAVILGTSPVSATDEVAGVATTSAAEAPTAPAPAAPPAPPLALTGNDVSVPLAVGAGLIAVGSMAVLVARKREDV